MKMTNLISWMKLNFLMVDYLVMLSVIQTGFAHFLAVVPPCIPVQVGTPEAAGRHCDLDLLRALAASLATRSASPSTRA